MAPRVEEWSVSEKYAGGIGRGDANAARACRG